MTGTNDSEERVCGYEVKLPDGCFVAPPHSSAWICHELFLPQHSELYKGALKVIYPDLTIDKCFKIPRDVREKISKEWGPPRVQLLGVEKKSIYTLIMVDPDAPSRENPYRAYWRHWLLTGIKGHDLMNGNIRGIELSRNWDPQAYVQRFGLTGPVASLQFLTQNRKD